jgi:hypothetical protein
MSPISEFELGARESLSRSSLNLKKRGAEGMNDINPSWMSIKGFITDADNWAKR